MNPWPFIVVAYATTLGGAAALTLWSYRAMAKTEASVDKLRAPSSRQ